MLSLPPERVIAGPSDESGRCGGHRVRMKFDRADCVRRPEAVLRA